MFSEKSAISDKTRGNLIKLIEPHFKFEQGNKLDNVISEVLHDKDLFLYMATHSIEDSGIILGRMDYFDDISVDVPYGITYDFKNPQLNIFTFDFCAFGSAKKPIDSLQLWKSLPSKKPMGMHTEEHYSNYPTVDSFLNSLNNILQKEVKKQTPFWVDFNKEFYS